MGKDEGSLDALEVPSSEVLLQNSLHHNIHLDVARDDGFQAVLAQIKGLDRLARHHDLRHGVALDALASQVHFGSSADRDVAGERVNLFDANWSLCSTTSRDASILVGISSWH